MSEEWYYTVAGQQIGPVSGSELKLLASRGKITRNDMVWKEGMSDWVPAEKLKGLFVGSGTASPPPLPARKPKGMFEGSGAASPLPFAPPSPKSSFSYNNTWESFTYAGFWKRFAACLLDAIVTTVGGFVIGFIIGFILVAGGTNDTKVLEAVGNLLGILISWLYYTVMESSSTQGTLGKMALGIKVTDLAGNRISFGRATGRYFSKILSAFLLMIGFIMIAFTEKKQGLHDMIAGCLVVNR
jgi:uncharacterized RDD family membrane protein YckC